MIRFRTVLEGAPITGTQDSELFLRTAQLLQFRLAFAAVGLMLAIVLNLLAKAEFDLKRVIEIAVAVVIYAAAGFALVKANYIRSPRQLKLFNAILLALDVTALTALVHFTLGVESDLYVLYLLPILLSSYSFSKVGIYATSLFVSTSYVALLLIENSSSLALLNDSGGPGGLANAYLQRLWGKILARSAILVCVSFIWGGFCGYISDLAQQITNKLREQLLHNQRLVAEVKAQAAREKLINSINSALRSTLDLELILHTAASELHTALAVPASAIVCPSDQLGEPVLVCEYSSGTKAEHLSADESSAFFPDSVCSFLLERRSNYERNAVDGSIIKTFIIPHPHQFADFAEIKNELEVLALSSLIVQPIIYGDQSEGIILIGDHSHARFWSPPELELIRAVAGQVAVAIENAKLVDQLSKTNEDLLRQNLQLDAKNVEIKAVQSQLVHQEKMASLGRLVAGIAHELNNPINFVHGNLPYLKGYCHDLQSIIAAADNVPDEKREAITQLKEKLKYDFLVTDLANILADLEDGTERIRHIIKNLRSFSRLDEAELKEASINEGLESTLKILSQYYGRDKIAAKTAFQDLPPVVCYPGQLNQVWMNLLSNAAQAVASAPDPIVSIDTAIVQDEVLITIADNGPGIKPDIQSKIFEPFFTTKPVGQGTGLGLSICHSIIERHQGKIWFESEQGSGTIFKVLIPIKAKAASSTPGETKNDEFNPIALSDVKDQSGNGQKPATPGEKLIGTP